MPVKVLYVDLRNCKSIFQSATIRWTEDKVAEDFVIPALWPDQFAEVNALLTADDPSIVASYIHDPAINRDRIVIKNFNQMTADDTVFFIVLEDGSTSDAQRNAAHLWMKRNGRF